MIEIRRIGIVMASLALALVCAAADPVSAIKSFTYGNWCGANHPPNLSDDPEPIDAVDAACRKHDLDYRVDGWSGEADSELARDLVRLMQSNALDDDEFANAVLIATWMTGQQVVTTAREDLGDGKVSSVVKIALATGEIAVLLPNSITAEALDEASEKLGGAGGKLLEITGDLVRAPRKGYSYNRQYRDQDFECGE